MQQPIDLTGAVSREELSDWTTSRVTRLYFTAVNNLVKERILQLGAGDFLDFENQDRTALQTAFQVGFLEGLKTCLRTEIDEPKQEDDNA